MKMMHHIFYSQSSNCQKEVIIRTDSDRDDACGVVGYDT